MIVTVTLNPAVDEQYLLPEFEPGSWNRAESSRRTPGGMGINVALTLSHLGYDVAAMGFLAGFNGDYIRDALGRTRITTNFVHVPGETRTNVYIVDNVGQVETGISEAGPQIPKQALRRFLDNYKRMTTRASAVVIGGSLPPGIPMDIYRDLCVIAKNVGLPVYIDASGPECLAAADSGPFFARVDHRFVSELCGHTVDSLDSLIAALQDVHDLGVQWAVASYQLYGDVYLTPKGLFLASLAEREQAVSLFRFGDALVAGMIAAHAEGMDVEEAVRFSMACAAEDSSHVLKGVSSREAAERCLAWVNIERLA